MNTIVRVNTLQSLRASVFLLGSNRKQPAAFLYEDECTPNYEIQLGE